WALSVYLRQEGKLYIVTLIPALFMTMVCSTYIFVAPEGFGLSYTLSLVISAIITLALLGLFLYKGKTKVL
ncbi:MAG: carbon starvation protein A, partial [Parabacteroides sp.]|nr:carbon starvation protein A [Parabacteroides sp.]